MDLEWRQNFRILSMNKWILTKFCTCIIINNIYLGIVKRPFSSICYRITALEWRQHLISAQYLENEWILTKFKLCIDIDYIYLGIVIHPFFVNSLQSYTSWMMSIFISAQYLDNKLMEFDQILILTRPRLGFLCVSIFANLQQGYGPWFMSEFRFHSISWEIVTEFHKILHMHWYWKHLDLDCFQFSQINNKVMTLDWCWNFVSAQYLWNKLMEFDQILQMHWYWQDLGWEMLSSYFTNLWPLIDVRIST